MNPQFFPQSVTGVVIAVDLLLPPTVAANLAPAHAVSANVVGKVV